MSAHLDRLLFAQGGMCFFCRSPLPKAEASIEHLVASSNGGANADDNCVACCRALNQLLGSKSIKEKLQIVLNQRGNFKCPAHLAPPPKAARTGARRHRKFILRISNKTGCCERAIRDAR